MYLYKIVLNVNVFWLEIYMSPYYRNRVYGDFHDEEIAEIVLIFQVSTMGTPIW